MQWIMTEGWHHRWKSKKLTLPFSLLSGRYLTIMWKVKKHEQRQRNYVLRISYSSEGFGTLAEGRAAWVHITEQTQQKKDLILDFPYYGYFVKIWMVIHCLHCEHRGQRALTRAGALWIPVTVLDWMKTFKKMWLIKKWLIPHLRTHYPQ